MVAPSHQLITVGGRLTKFFCLRSSLLHVLLASMALPEYLDIVGGFYDEITHNTWLCTVKFGKTNYHKEGIALLFKDTDGSKGTFMYKLQAKNQVNSFSLTRTEGSCL